MSGFTLSNCTDCRLYSRKGPINRFECIGTREADIAPLQERKTNFKSIQMNTDIRFTESRVNVFKTKPLINPDCHQKNTRDTAC